MTTFYYRRGSITYSFLTQATYKSEWEASLAVRKSTISYIPLTTNFSHIFLTHLRTRKSGVTYGLLNNNPYEIGIFIGGYNILGGEISNFDRITINTLGNAIVGGSLSFERSGSGATSNGSGNIGLDCGGHRTAFINGPISDINYSNLSTSGNSIHFGYLTYPRNNTSTVSNSTSQRSICMGGGHYGIEAYNAIDYNTINTPGNAIDLADLSISTMFAGNASNGTNDRAINYGGADGVSVSYTNIQYKTISNSGNATTFGYIITGWAGVGASSNGTNERGVFGGGVTDLGFSDVIAYVTINSLGNAIVFGNLTVIRDVLTGLSNAKNERGIFGSGYVTGTTYNTIDYITINSLGNAIDFGDLTGGMAQPAGCSNGI